MLETVKIWTCNDKVVAVVERDRDGFHKGRVTSLGSISTRTTRDPDQAIEDVEQILRAIGLTRSSVEAVHME